MFDFDLDSETRQKNTYLKNTERSNPLAFPGCSEEILAKFSPTLLITGTRDFGLSDVVYTHSQLTRLGIEAELHVWEGMDHAFFYNPKLPESHEAKNVIVRFFDKHLGKE